MPLAGYIIYDVINSDYPAPPPQITILQYLIMVLIQYGYYCRRLLTDELLVAVRTLPSSFLLGIYYGYVYVCYQQQQQQLVASGLAKPSLRQLDPGSYIHHPSLNTLLLPQASPTIAATRLEHGCLLIITKSDTQIIVILPRILRFLIKVASFTHILIAQI